jgi:hypothetical protein
VSIYMKNLVDFVQFGQDQDLLALDVLWYVQQGVRALSVGRPERAVAAKVRTRTLAGYLSPDACSLSSK